MVLQRLLCIDDDKDFLIGISLQLREYFKIQHATSIEEGLEVLKEKSVDMVLLDVNLGSEDGISAIRRIKKHRSDVDVIMLSGRRDPKTVVDAIRAGASDYITKPFDKDELLAIAERQAGSRRVRQKYEALIETQNESLEDRIIFKTADMQRLIFQADQLKGHHANVLIVGETGTGKELFAQYIHKVEGQPGRPFIAVNCAAIPDNLLEAELFGAEVGAYTGAVKRRIGKFELADGGDIFLDEIGALKLELQAKILRVLQEKEFTRLGGNEVIRADCRVIAATNEPLEEKVMRGDFRMDLYHRVRVIQLSIPPLRDRPEDVVALVDHYLAKYSKGATPKNITPGALAKLMAYHWPGNVRELGNVIQSLTIVTEVDSISESAFPSWALNGCSGAGDVDRPMSVPSISSTVGALKEYVSSAERTYIQHAINSCGGDKSKAARMLKLGRTTLYTKMKDLGIM